MMKNCISFKMTHWQDEYVSKVPKKVRARQTWGVSGPMPGVRIRHIQNESPTACARYRCRLLPAAVEILYFSAVIAMLDENTTLLTRPSTAVTDGSNATGNAFCQITSS